jgi:hypothetical protein
MGTTQSFPGYGKLKDPNVDWTEAEVHPDSSQPLGVMILCHNARFTDEESINTVSFPLSQNFFHHGLTTLNILKKHIKLFNLKTKIHVVPETLGKIMRDSTPEVSGRVLSIHTILTTRWDNRKLKDLSTDLKHFEPKFQSGIEKDFFIKIFHVCMPIILHSYVSKGEFEENDRIKITEDVVNRVITESIKILDWCQHNVYVNSVPLKMCAKKWCLSLDANMATSSLFSQKIIVDQTGVEPLKLSTEVTSLTSS